MDFFNKVGETITNKGKDVTKKVNKIHLIKKNANRLKRHMQRLTD